MGDGWLRKDGIAMSTTDVEFASAFDDAIRAHFHRPPRWKSYGSTWMIGPNDGRRYRRRPHVTVLFRSRPASSFLASIRNKAWIEALSKANKIAWLRGLWDAEGSITKQLRGNSWSVRFHNKDFGLASLYRKILSEVVGISGTLYREKDDMWIVRFGKLPDVVTFLKVVSPTILRKRERFEQARAALVLSRRRTARGIR